MKRIAGRRHGRFPFKRRLISVAVMSAVSSHVGANPTGPQVVNGQASFATQAGTLTVTNSPNAIVNWQSFSIGSSETTRFVQQSAASAVLNRVVGVDPSRILGTLQSNGKVFLVNTNGILFGQGARIDVAGLVASTLNLNDADFLAGRLNFESSPLGQQRGQPRHDRHARRRQRVPGRRCSREQRHHPRAGRPGHPGGRPERCGSAAPVRPTCWWRSRRPPTGRSISARSRWARARPGSTAASSSRRAS